MHFSLQLTMFYFRNGNLQIAKIAVVFCNQRDRKRVGIRVVTLMMQCETKLSFGIAAGLINKRIDAD